MKTPQYTHDCKRCIWLGHHYGPNSHTTGPWASEDQTPIHTDLYYCPGPNPGLVARYSSDGPDYTSRRAIYDRREPNPWDENSKHINEARKRAAEAGYIPPLKDYHPALFLDEESNSWVVYHTQQLEQAHLLTTTNEDDAFHIDQLAKRFDITPEEAKQELTNWRNAKTGDNS